MLGQALDFRFDGRFNFSQGSLLFIIDGFELNRGFLSKKYVMCPRNSHASDQTDGFHFA
jgi:hypothetical protein